MPVTLLTLMAYLCMNSAVLTQNYFKQAQSTETSSQSTEYATALTEEDFSTGNLKTMVGGDVGWGVRHTVSITASSIAFVSSYQGNPCSLCTNKCTAGALERVPTTNYVITGFLLANFCSNYGNYLARYDTSSASDPFSGTYENLNTQFSVTSISFIGGTKLLFGDKLTIYDYASNSYPTTSTSAISFRFIKCASSTACYASDTSSCKVYAILNPGFLAGSSNALIPVHSTPITTGTSKGFTLFSNLDLHVICSSTTCALTQISNPSAPLATLSGTSVSGLATVYGKQNLLLLGRDRSVDVYTVSLASGFVFNTWWLSPTQPTVRFLSQYSLVLAPAVSVSDSKIYFYQGGTCTAPCVSCFSTATNCTKCDQTTALKFLQNMGTYNSCVACSTPGYFEDNSGSSPLCSVCNNNCATCQTTAVNCLTCNSPLVLSAANSTCAACGGGYFLAGNPQKCFECDLNCKTCSTTATTCTSCTSPQALSDTSPTCVTCGAGSFINANGKCAVCDQNCATCIDTAVKCTSCNAPLSLSPASSQCTSCQDGQFSDVNLVCTDCSTTCNTCVGTSTNCTSCVFGSSLDVPSHTCIQCPTTSGRFITGSNPTICDYCNPNCNSCEGVSTRCTSCTNGLYISAANSTCTPCGSGYFVNPTDNKCYQCSVNCLTCGTTATTCSSCVSSSFLDGTQCTQCHPDCTRCTKASETGCSSCDRLKGLYLGSQNGTCTSCSGLLFQLTGTKCIPRDHLDLRLDGVWLSRGNTTNKELLLNLTISCNQTDLSLKISGDDMFRTLQPTIKLVEGPLKTPIQISSSNSSWINSTVLSTNISMVSEVSSTLAIEADLSSQIDLWFEVQGTYYNLSKFGHQFTVAGIPVVGSGNSTTTTATGGVAGGLISMTPFKDETSTEIIAIVVSADPSGVVSKFSQLIKIFNRLFFLNVYFGESLGGFLSQIEQYSSTKSDQMSIKYQESLRLGSRAKLTQRRVITRFETVFHWKIGLYLLSSLFKILCDRVMGDTPSISKGMLKVLYFMPKIHLIFFNMVFLDIAFYSTFTFQNSTNAFSVILSYFCITFLAVDVLEMVTIVDSTRSWVVWSKFAEKVVVPAEDKHTTTTSTDLSPISKTEQSMNKGLQDTSVQGASTSNPPVGAVSQGNSSPDHQQINYSRTYDNIRAKVHLLAVMASSIKTDRKSLAPRGARIMFVLHLVKVISYQTLIVVSQLSPLTAIIPLICLEIGRSFIAVTLQFKHKSMLNWVAFGCEISQSLFLTVFLLLCLGMPFSTPQGDVNHHVQALGIYLILISVCVEYILTLSQIGMSLYELLDRKRKKLKVVEKPHDWYLEFYEMPIQMKPICAEAKQAINNLQVLSNIVRVQSPVVKDLPRRHATRKRIQKPRNILESSLANQPPPLSEMLHLSMFPGLRNGSSANPSKLARSKISIQTPAVKG